MGVTPRLPCARTATTTCSGTTTIRPPPRRGLLRSWYLTTLLGSSSTPSTCSNWSSCREYLKLLYLQQTWKNYIKMRHDSYMRAWWIMMKNVFVLNWAEITWAYLFVVYVYDLILTWVGKGGEIVGEKKVFACLIMLVCMSSDGHHIDPHHIPIKMTRNVNWYWIWAMQSHGWARKVAITPSDNHSIFVLSKIIPFALFSILETIPQIFIQ